MTGYVTKADCLTPDVLATLDEMLFNAGAPDRDRVCSGCGDPIHTEGDFVRHFVLADARYLNLGECPKTDKGRAIMRAGTRNIPFYKQGAPVVPRQMEDQS